MCNFEFMVSSVILMATILKISHYYWQFRLYSSRANRLILTQEMSLNKVIHLMEVPVGCTVTPPGSWTNWDVLITIECTAPIVEMNKFIEKLFFLIYYSL